MKELQVVPVANNPSTNTGDIREVGSIPRYLLEEGIAIPLPVFPATGT